MDVLLCRVSTDPCNRNPCNSRTQNKGLSCCLQLKRNCFISKLTLLFCLINCLASQPGLQCLYHRQRGATQGAPHIPQRLVIHNVCLSVLTTAVALTPCTFRNCDRHLGHFMVLLASTAHSVAQRIVMGHGRLFPYLSTIEHFHG
jgi:hypothetical protein